MRTNLGSVLVFLLLGCGREVVDEQSATEPASSGGGVAGSTVAAGGSAQTALEPGWYDVPADPVRHLGLLVLQPLDGQRLETTLMLAEMAPRADYTIAVAWRGAPQLQTLTTLQKGSPRVQLRLAPPLEALKPSRCGARRATGVVFVLADGELIGASAGGWVSDLELVFDECDARPAGGGSFELRRDARLEHARCLALGGKCVNVSPVRVTSGDVRIDDQLVALDTTVPLVDSNTTVSLEVNGVVVSDQWRLPRELFRAGKNRVTVRMGQHPAWEANVVLPSTALAPQVVAPLKVGAPFSVAFAASWATGHDVHLFPIDVPVTRAVYPSFSSPTSPVEGTFEGFPDGRGGRVSGTRASVVVSATRSDGAFTLTQTTSYETPSRP